MTPIAAVLDHLPKAEGLIEPAGGVPPGAVVFDRLLNTDGAVPCERDHLQPDAGVASLSKETGARLEEEARYFESEKWRGNFAEKASAILLAQPSQEPGFI